jgi:hypothetical protein
MHDLRFRHFKWDTYACGTCLVLPEALVLSAQAHQDVVRIVESLHGALVRFERRVRHDQDALRQLGIPPVLFPLIADEPEHGLELARYDLFPTEDGRWMVSEFNEDVPGGFNESVGLPDLLGDPGDGLLWAGDLRRAFVDAFDGHDRVALLYATAFSEDLQHVLALERWLVGPATTPCWPRRPTSRVDGNARASWANPLTPRSASIPASGCRGCPTSARGSPSGRASL